jgi:hypothetical protein
MNRPVDDAELKDAFHQLAAEVDGSSFHRELGEKCAAKRKGHRRGRRVSAWAIGATVVVLLVALGFGVNALVQHLGQDKPVVTITDDPMQPTAPGTITAGTTITTETAASTVSTAASPQPITSHWPPGIEAVVLSSEDGLYVVDARGVRWSQENEAVDQPSTTVTVHGPQIVSGLYGLAVSSNDKFIAYVEGARRSSFAPSRTAASPKEPPCRPRGTRG